MTADEIPTYRCRASIDGVRCDYRATRDDLDVHADEAGHPRCVVCTHTLGEFERQACDQCSQNVRDDLASVAVAYAHLERVIGQSAYHGMAWNALALAGDGSLESPQTPNQYTQPREVGPTVHVEHRELAGDHLTLTAYIEQRVPSDGREHVRDHWRTDPLSVLAFLEKQERDWRLEFGHGPATDIATVANCLRYLREWHTLASRTHPGFDDYAAELKDLRSAAEHAVGLADDPRIESLPCPCGGRLVRRYLPCECDPRKPHRCGLVDDATCRSCDLVVTRHEYLWRLRIAVHMPGWVSVSEAAGEVDRPMRTVQSWARDIDDPLMVPTVCNRLTRRVMVELAAVRERSDETPRRMREAS